MLRLSETTWVQEGFEVKTGSLEERAPEVGREGQISGRVFRAPWQLCSERGRGA